MKRPKFFRGDVNEVENEGEGVGGILQVTWAYKNNVSHINESLFYAKAISYKRCVSLFRS